MIDFTKEYKTKSGKRVIGLYNIPYNSAGEKVTYPVKGSIVLSETPFRTKYQIWSEDGKVDVVFGKNSSEDLVLA